MTAVCDALRGARWRVAVPKPRAKLAKIGPTKSGAARTKTVLFDRVAFIGIGLIGASMALAMRRAGLARSIVGCARRPKTRKTALSLGVVDEATADYADAVTGADLVVIATPVGTNGMIAKAISAHLKPGAIVTDVGSVKQAVVDAVAPHIPKGVHFVPAHPIAGTEHSGPEAGFAELFDRRWTILTPLPRTSPKATAKIADMWRKMGANVANMQPEHHDMVLAITSHLPHLIAYTIVGTAADLGGDLKQEVIKYSASGFRDFTRIAASDPIMWRDIFLNNRDAVLEILQRFTEDLTAMQRVIRKADAKALEESFTRTRAIRCGIIEAKQA
ncbi:MAG: prephenate/arogenate dehydrogenase family protein [Rhodospirillaceae bacterium]|nr:prephenate/arogenate dehydrogenase family protein [Rhodospirillaceae bacterium]